MSKQYFIYFLLISGICFSSVHAASFKDGEDAFKNRKYKIALAIWEDLADENDLAAQFKLAEIYEMGSGVKANKETSFKYYSMAMEQGSLDAQLKIGMFYMTGQGVKQDKEKARELYRQAAYKGHAKSQYYYGVTYFRGEGVQTDYVTANAWMRVAAENGYEHAKNSSEHIENVLSRSDLKKSQALAKKLLSELKKVSVSK